MAKTRWETEPEKLLRVDEGFALSDVDPDSTPGFDGDEEKGEKELKRHVDELADLQERLFAESRAGGNRRILLILQAMDTAGKGGIVRHVVGGVDPQGVKLHAFKSPSDEEKAHDFLWRIRRQLPEPGLIGVFDRSHYEDVLIHRVRGFSAPDVIEERYDIIRDFEQELVDDGTTIVKVMLHISSDEQKARLQERLDRPDKNWKFNPGDVDERMLWSQYMDAYQIALERTSTEGAPWYVVPADNKWYARIAVQRLLLNELRGLDPQWPAAEFDVEEQKKRLAGS
ncbi:PPK2 family polyphosphate:nucleotide phosphotransferase [Homoserinimonas aerilata]|uniref:PPK2 family polyphosphate:nucleotide phosphotransferase n=1 Tax=Homoserinimonas aerilata TaxID=1162970 RepID=A0A542YAC8_9MICO|nr:polyphosphate kinase 2 family protein [Homoserinimonas aerilata]TQL44993.1 PPK2 family polyphosphate:nucleotide phosphotransferase [Homoserinimonas aerilata]